MKKKIFHCNYQTQNEYEHFVEINCIVFAQDEEDAISIASTYYDTDDKYWIAVEFCESDELYEVDLYVENKEC